MGTRASRSTEGARQLNFSPAVVGNGRPDQHREGRLTMLTMAVGQSDDVDPATAIREAIEQCRTQLDGRAATGALLFVAYDLFDLSLPAAVRAAFPGVQLVGATSAAQVSSS